MKTKLLFTIVGISVMFSFQVFSSMPAENSDMQSEAQFASGKVLTVKVYSPGIANNTPGDDAYRKVTVYLPPGYDENLTTNYSVIYMLSDVNETNEGWFQALGSTNFIDILDKMIKLGTIKPSIMVFPDGKNKFGGGWYTNSTVTGKWEDFVVKDVVDYIDKNFRTLPFAASRGVAGKGMGGYGALKLATRHSDVFSAVYSLNALINFETIITDTIIWNNSFKIAAQATNYPTGDAFANQLLGMAVAFTPNSSNPSGWNLPKTETGGIVAKVYQQWLEQDPLYMIQGNIKNLKELKAITVDCSTSGAGIILSSNYAKALKNNNIKHTFSYFAGTDNSVLLKRVTDILLPMFSETLAHSLLETDNDPHRTPSEILKAGLITDGRIYLVPAKTPANPTSIEADKIVRLDVKANEQHDIPLTSLNKGIYQIYGISNTGFIGKPFVFGLNGGMPQVKICVTDSYTGEIIKTCGLKLNGGDCIPNANGEFCFCAEGEINLCLSKENYSMLMKSATILTDTTLNYSLVKDSYIQVVERGNGMPIFEATVTHEKVATLTGSNGFATVQNLRDGVLDCRVFKSGYFTETLNTMLAPGKTAVVKLTHKKASVNFVLIGNQGHLEDGNIKIGGVTYKPDQYGKLNISDIDTRQEYSYIIDNASYEVVQGSFFLEADTTLSFFLQPKNMANLKSDLVTAGRPDIQDSQILIYPNPATHAVTVQSGNIKGFTVELKSATGAILYTAKIEGTLHQINMSNLSNGVYFVTVKSDNFYYAQKIMKL